MLGPFYFWLGPFSVWLEHFYLLAGTFLFLAGTFLFLAGAFLFVAGAFQFLAGTFLFMVGTFLDTVRAHRYLWRAWAVGQGAARDFGKGEGDNSAVSSQAIPGPGPTGTRPGPHYIGNPTYWGSYIRGPDPDPGPDRGPMGANGV